MSCQHLGDECKLGGFCAPFRRRVGVCKFKNYIFVLDIFCQHLGNICQLNIYHANNWGMNVSWRVSVCPSGTGLENVHFWKMYIVVWWMSGVVDVLFYS